LVCHPVAVYIYTQNNTQNNTNNNRTTQTTTNVEECGPCPVFASFTLAFVLKLKKMLGKTPARVRKKSQSDCCVYIYIYIYIYIYTHIYIHIYTYIYFLPKHPHITKSTQTHALQNNIKPPQYKLKQTQYKIYPNEIVTI